MQVTVPLRSRERAFARTMADILLSNMPDEWCSFSKNSAYIRFSFSDYPAEKMRVSANSSWTLRQCAGRKPMQFMAPSQCNVERPAELRRDSRIADIEAAGVCAIGRQNDAMCVIYKTRTCHCLAARENSGFGVKVT